MASTNLVGSFLGAQSGLTNSSGQTTSDLLVSAYKQTRQPDVDAATKVQTTLKSKQSFYNTLRSKLTALSDTLTGFTASDASSKFVTRSSTSSDATIASVTVDSTAQSGINTVKVNRLASNDILIGKQLAFNSTDTFAVTGNQTFKINGQDISVNIADGATNEQALKTISTAINTALGSNSAINARASYVKDTETTGRLTLTSNYAGAGNSIAFSDNGSGVLNALGLDNVDPNSSDRTQKVSDPTQAYYKTSNKANLSSSFEINGITISRNTNTISDVLDGTTITLLKPQATTDQPVTLTTDVSESSVEGVINPLITAYNDTIKYLNQNNAMKRSESAVGNLFSNLRSISSQAVSSAADGNPKYLADMGIKTNSDGTLIITDMTTLTNLLKDDPKKVSDLFTGTDGIASKITNALSNLIGTDGLINTKTSSLGTQIDTATKKIQTLNDSITKQADALQKQYTTVYSAYLTATQQFSYLSSASASSTTTA